MAEPYGHRLAPQAMNADDRSAHGCTEPPELIPSESSGRNRRRLAGTSPGQHRGGSALEDLRRRDRQVGQQRGGKRFVFLDELHRLRGVAGEIVDLNLQQERIDEPKFFHARAGVDSDLI